MDRLWLFGDKLYSPPDKASAVSESFTEHPRLNRAPSAGFYKI
jgi:hypothetical protein